MRSPVLSLLISVMVEMSFLCMPASAADELPFSVTISGQQTVALGDDINIRALLKNVSTHTIPIVWGDPYIILVHAEGGKDPDRKTGVYGGSSILIDLEPGQTSTSVVDLSKAYDLSVPGKYVVQFQRHLDFRDPKSPIVNSNELTITVVPKRDWARWLERDPDAPPPIDLLRPFDSDAMQTATCNPAVGNVRNNGPEMLVCPPPDTLPLNSA